MTKQDNPRCVTIVRAAGSSTETRLVFLAVLITLVISASSIGLRNISSGNKETPEWQIEAYSSLSPQELAVFNALISAGAEIENYHADEGGWPEVRDLEEDYIPPFVRDTAWVKSGSIVWDRKVLSQNMNHVVLYRGVAKDQDIVSSTFLLVIMHDHVKKQGNAGVPEHAPYEIWMHSSPDKTFPVIVNDQALINTGWKEVVARRGEDEMKKTKGEEFM